jgi:flavorubredoxin
MATSIGYEIMKKAMIVYDTVFGNTEKVASALAQGLESSHTVSVTLSRASETDAIRLSECDILLVGAPTHAWNASKPIKEFLQRISKSGLKGKRAFAFDTKMRSRMAGSAAKQIEKELSKLGAEIVRASASAIVQGREGPLEEGTESTFMSIGLDLANMIR